MEIIVRLRLMRLAEGLSDVAFAMEVGIPTMKYIEYERGGSDSMPLSELITITNHPRFAKYTLWLLTATDAPSVSQVAPDISTMDPWIDGEFESDCTIALVHRDAIFPCRSRPTSIQNFTRYHYPARFFL